jgi:hypothetical protein
MSTYKLHKVIRKELESLNDKIDEKILKGMSYVREARRHKFLLSQLYGLRRSSGNFLYNLIYGGRI